eukprot:7063870-Prymnesium_polylepis.1
MEQISLQSDAEFDARAAERLASLSEEAARLEASQAELSARWEAEKGRLEGIRGIKESIERTNSDIELAVRGPAQNLRARARPQPAPLRPPLAFAP